MDAEAVLQAIETNPGITNTQRESGDLGAVVFVTFTTSANASRFAEWGLMFLKYCETFDSPNYQNLKGEG